MKTLIVKQKYDCFGPWMSFDFDKTSPLLILSTFYSKGGFPFEFILHMEADYRIVENLFIPDWVKTASNLNEDYMKSIEKFTQGVTTLEEIDFDKYDLVYIQDGFLQNSDLKTKHKNTLFIATVAEHGEMSYNDRANLDSHDLILDHTLNSINSLVELPQKINFPLLRCPYKIKEIFNNDKEPVVYLDYRTLSYLSVENSNIAWDKYDASPTIEKLNNLLNNLTVTHNADITKAPWMVFYPPKYNDAVNYNIKLSKAKYYVMAVKGDKGSIIGQAMADAASHECICIGNANVEYHKMICHPLCLVENCTEEEIASRINLIESDERLKKEILEYQTYNINWNFMFEPTQMLINAYEMKKNANTA